MYWQAPQRFDVGDQVIYTPTQSEAIVIKFLGNDEFLVEFTDKNLIPPQMKVPGYTIIARPLPASPYYGSVDWNGDFMKPRYNKETQCPRCGGPWKETVVFRNTYYDCLKCNLKKEDA